MEQKGLKGITVRRNHFREVDGLRPGLRAPLPRMHVTGFDHQGGGQTNKWSVGGTTYGKLVNSLLYESYEIISLIVFVRKPPKLAYIFDWLSEPEWGQGRKSTVERLACPKLYRDHKSQVKLRNNENVSKLRPY